MVKKKKRTKRRKKECRGGIGARCAGCKLISQRRSQGLLALAAPTFFIFSRPSPVETEPAESTSFMSRNSRAAKGFRSRSRPTWLHDAFSLFTRSEGSACKDSSLLATGTGIIMSVPIKELCGIWFGKCAPKRISSSHTWTPKYN